MKIHRVLLFYVTQVKVELCIIYMYIERKWQMNRQVVRIQEGSRFVSTISISQSELVPGDISLLTEWRNTSFGDIIQRRKPPDPVHSSSPIHLSVHLSICLECLSVPLSIHPPTHWLFTFFCLYLYLLVYLISSQVSQ